MASSPQALRRLSLRAKNSWRGRRENRGGATMTSRFARKVVASALLGILSIAAPVVHADGVTMMGQGLQSCATWTQKRNAAMTEAGKMERAGAEAWVAGFLSAAGWYAQAKN